MKITQIILVRETFSTPAQGWLEISGGQLDRLANHQRA